MRNELTKIAYAVGFGLALAFTFGCSSDDKDSSSSGGGQSGIIHGTPVTYEGQTYKTVKIGEQVWMAENLNYNAAGSRCYGEGGGVYVDGESTVTLSDAEIQANCTKYGRLYNWSTTMSLPSNCNSTSCASQIGAKHKGICPNGWHIPSDADWNNLVHYIDGTNPAGRYLKATSGWKYCGNDNSYSYKCEDKYGFAALPGGNGHSDGSFDNVGYYSSWWSTTEDNASYAYRRRMDYNHEDVDRRYFDKSRLFSVRCLQD